MITLTYGRIQNASSLPITPNGYMELYLNGDAQVVAEPRGQVLGGTTNFVRFLMDENGDLIQPVQIWSNSELNPQNEDGLGTWYVVNFYDQNGTRLNNKPMQWVFDQPNGSTVDISTMVPLNPEGIFYPVPYIASPEPANTFFSGPVSGADALPTFRHITPADLPVATTSAEGIVQPDGTTITITDGVISAVGIGNTDFALITSGTNTQAEMVVGSGASLYADGGTVNANLWDGISLTGAPTAVGQVPIIQAGETSATWSPLPVATTSIFGIVKPDGTTVTVVDGVISAVGGDGTVTSVTVTVPARQTVTGSPLTTSGTIAITDNSQSANLFFASPNGSSGAPTFRAVAPADLPLATTSAFGAVKPDGTTIISTAGVLSASLVGGAGGDLAGSYPSPTVVQISGGTIPVSAGLVGTNSSKQLIAVTGTIANSTSGNAATATALSTTGSNGNYWGVSGGVQGWLSLPAGFITSITTTGTSGAATVTSGVLNIPNYQAISGLTAGYIPLAGSATTLTGNSHLDDGVTTAGTITSTETIVAPQMFAGQPSLNNAYFGGAGNLTGTGGGNMAMGVNALTAVTIGVSNMAIGVGALNATTDGDYNTAVGAGALAGATSHIFNTAIGTSANAYNTTGNRNTAIGAQSGSDGGVTNYNTTGSNNTWIGYSAGPSTTTQLSNSTAIGNGAVVGASNTVVIGNTSVTDTYLKGVVHASAVESLHVGVGTPTITVGVGAGTGATAAISGNNMSGIITITGLTFGQASPGDVVCTILFGGGPLAFVPNSVVMCPITQDSNLSFCTTTPYAYGWSMIATNENLIGDGTFQWCYICL